MKATTIVTRGDPQRMLKDFNSTLVSLNNWRALTRYLDDGNVPIDNNAVKNRSGRSQ